MDEYDSQSTVEDVSEWAEHIEDLIDELQRNYRIIQTEMSCLVEKLQLFNQRPKNYIPKRVVLSKKHRLKNNENSRNIRNCCNGCHGSSTNRNSREYMNIEEKLGINIGALSEQYINNLIQNNLASVEKSLLEKLDRNCTHQHLEFQRNITDLKIQQSITETTVRDIAIQIQQVATEIKEIKNNIQEQEFRSASDHLRKENKLEEVEDSSSCLSSNSSSNMLSQVCTCISSKCTSNKMEIIEILRDVFVEDEELVGIGNNLENVELENLCLIRQLFKDFVRLLTQKRIEAIEESIGELRNKISKNERINEDKMNDINELIKDELMNKSLELAKITKLEQRIQNVTADFNNIEDNVLKLEGKIKETTNKELNNEEKIQALEKELIKRSELMQMAIRELNEEYKLIKQKSTNESSFDEEISKTIIEKIKNIKELVSYITEDVFKNEEKLQRQIRKNSLNLEDLKKCCIEFERYSDDNFNEIANSIQNFRLQTIGTLSSICELIGENDNNLTNFQSKLQENYPEINELHNLLDEPHFFSHKKNMNINNSDKNLSLNIGKINLNDSNSILPSLIPPNAYHTTLNGN